MNRFEYVITLAVCAALFGVHPSYAKDPPAEAVRGLEEGNRLLAAGAYGEAAAAFERVEASGWASAALYTHLGNAYFRMDRLGPAVRSYERARRLQPEDPLILHNIEVAESKTADHLTRAPEPYWEGWERSLARFPGAKGLFLMGWPLFVAGLALVFYGRMAGHTRAWLRRAQGVTLVAGAALCVLAFGVSVAAAERREAVVLEAAVPVRDAVDAPEAATEIHEGTTVDLLEIHSDWWRVRLPDGTEGWIRAGAAGEI